MSRGWRERQIWIWLGLALILLGILLPSGWYDQLPRFRTDLPVPPMKGVTLIRLALGLDGLLLLVLGLRGRLWPTVREGDRLSLPEPEGARREDLRHPALWVAGATALAAALRFHDLGSDLWVDEISTVLEHRQASPFQILLAPTTFNNHLLNSLLVKGTVQLFGMREWAIRLPAVLFGIASIPAQYALARLALSRRDAVLAAILLAVSYHHVFFSQNARGYTGLLFFSLLSSIGFLRGISRNRTGDWVLYGASTFLAVATMLFGFFVLLGHALVLPVLAWTLRRQGKPVLPLPGKALAIWAGLGLLSFHLYASTLPQAYANSKLYTGQALGYSPFSLEYLAELQRGLSAGFGAGALAGVLVALAVMSVGFLAFFRRHTLYSLTLISPLLALVPFLLVFRLNVSPRFFLWGLPIALIFALGMVTLLGNELRSSRWIRSGALRKVAAQAPLALVGFLLLLSLYSLRDYYLIRKQPTRQSLEWVLAHRQADDRIVAVYLAKWGLRFYGPSFGLQEGSSFLVVESREEMQRLDSRNPGQTVWLLTTFPRGLRMRFPTLDSYIRERYRIEKTFPATVGDGEISVWRRNPI